MKILRVGDPHIRVSNLAESERLMKFVTDLALEKKVDRIELLGDQFHNHAVLRLEVIQFWEHWLDILSDICEVVALEGNHDQSGDYKAGYSAMSIFRRLKKPGLYIVTERWTLGPIGYIPYTHDPEFFIASINEMADVGVQTIVAHQTFSGSKYDSGALAHDGIDTTRISDKIIHLISGHIHTRQENGRIDYPGTARWDTVADANQVKGVWIYEHDNYNGKVLSKEFFGTESVCTPLYQLSYIEGADEPTIPGNARVTLELVGSSDWVLKQKLKFKGKAMFKTKITDTLQLEGRKTGTSFEDYLMNIYQNTSLVTADRQSLLRMAKEMGIV